MAHITSFSIQGLAGRQGKISFELNRDVNIFWGLNGSGKTSLLKILHCAMANQASPLERLPFRSAQVNISSLVHGHVRRTIDLRNIHLPEVDEATFDDAYTFDESVGRFVPDTRLRWKTTTLEKMSASSSDREPRAFRHGYLPISRVAGSGFLNRDLRRPAVREAIDEAWFDTAFARQVSGRWQYYNAEALGRIREVQQTGLAEILSVLFGGRSRSKVRRESSIDPSAAYSLIASFLRGQNIHVNFDRASFEKRYSLDEDLREIVQRIDTITAEIDVALMPQTNFNRLIGELYTGNKKLEVSARSISVMLNEKKIPLESLSSGEKQLLQIFLEILAGGENAVIIDEPELSMHVDWQNRLVQSMRVINPSCQLILATHSPEIMANVDDQSIFEL